MIQSGKVYKLILQIDSDYAVGYVIDNAKNEVASDVVNMHGLDNGIVVNLQEFQNSLYTLVHKLETKLNTKLKKTYVLLPSEQIQTTCISTQIKAKTTFTKDHIIKMVNQLKKACNQSQIYMIKQFPYSIKLDGQEIINPIGMEGGVCKITWSILHMQQSFINNFKKAFANLYLQVLDYSISDYELTDQLLEKDEKNLGAFVINVKNKNTIAYIIKNSIPVSIINIKQGYNSIDKDIAVKFNISVNEAKKFRLKYCRGVANESDKNVHIKIRQRNIDEKTISHYEFIQSTIPSIKKLISHLNNSFEEHVKSTYRLFLIGQLAKISGIEFILNKFFQKNMHLLNDSYNTSTELKHNLISIKSYVKKIISEKEQKSRLHKINHYISLWLKKIYDMIKR